LGPPSRRSTGQSLFHRAIMENIRYGGQTLGRDGMRRSSRALRRLHRKYAGGRVGNDCRRPGVSCSRADNVSAAARPQGCANFLLDEATRRSDSDSRKPSAKHWIVEGGRKRHRNRAQVSELAQFRSIVVLQAGRVLRGRPPAGAALRSKASIDNLVRREGSPAGEHRLLEPNTARSKAQACCQCRSKLALRRPARI